MDARSVLGVSAVRKTFLDNLSAAGARQAETDRGRLVIARRQLARPEPVEGRAVLVVRPAHHERYGVLVDDDIDDDLDDDEDDSIDTDDDDDDEDDEHGDDDDEEEEET